MIRYYQEFWTKLFVFNATATRAQYWTAYIINGIVIWLYAVLTHQQGYLHNGHYALSLSANSLIFGILLLLAWCANFTVRARRLHDSNHSNWWLLISIIPLIGGIWLFILLLLPTQKNARWSINQSEIN